MTSWNPRLATVVPCVSSWTEIPMTSATVNIEFTKGSPNCVVAAYDASRCSGAGFIVATLVWRGAGWLIPYVGVVLYLGVTVWGIGGWVLGAWETRQESALPPEDDPFVRAGKPIEVPDGWEPPLAP